MKSSWLHGLLPTLLALAIALVAGDLLMLAYGQSPGHVWSVLLQGTWGDAKGFGQVLYKATTLTCTGLAVALSLRAGLFNVGAEAQLAAGGFCAALVGLALPSGLPVLLAAPLCVLGAMAGGGLVGAVPGVLKAKMGAHEVIVTIMMNGVIIALLNYIVASHLHVPGQNHTPDIHAGMVPRLESVWPALHGSAANWTLAVVLAVAVALAWLLFRTRAGYDLRAVGLQPEAAEYAGISLGRVWLWALIASGALAGLGGINFVLGYKGYYEDGMTSGAGFLGIAVALVGRNHPLGVPLAAFFFATLSQGGLAVHALVPKQIVEVLQGVVILAVAISVPEVRRLLASAKAAVGPAKRTEAQP
jgi:ABC-type uncharacterized transport system permease subunit